MRTTELNDKVLNHWTLQLDPPKIPKTIFLMPHETEGTFSSVRNELNFSREAMKGHSATKGQHHEQWAAAIANVSELCYSAEYLTAPIKCKTTWQETFAECGKCIIKYVLLSIATRAALLKDFLVSPQKKLHKVPKYWSVIISKFYNDRESVSR